MLNVECSPFIFVSVPAADTRRALSQAHPTKLPRVLPIVIAGPTGTGKSELALRIAEAIGGEIVNYDSVQIYRGFDIGSAKPSAEVRALVPHHLFDVIDADQEFNAAEYARLARATSENLEAPILV